MKLGGSLPHSKESTTCPYPSQINQFLCPSHFWQSQLVSFLVGLRTYQHPGTYRCSLWPKYLCETCNLSYLPTKPPEQWVTGHCRESKAAGAWRWPPAPSKAPPGLSCSVLE